MSGNDTSIGMDGADHDIDTTGNITSEVDSNINVNHTRGGDDQEELR